MITNHVHKGRLYRLKYRVQNANGWSSYSDKSFVLAASNPSKPTSKPYLVSVTDTTIKIAVDKCVNSNGAPISQYKLYMK